MRKKLLFLLVLGGWILSHSVWAYAPPSGFVLKKIASRRANARTFRVKSMVSRVEDGHPVGVKVKVITAVDLASHTLKSRAFSETGTELYSIERSINAVSSTQKSSRGLISAAVNSLLFESSPDALIRVIRDVGIPIIQESDLKSELTADERTKIEKISLVRGPVNERGHELPKVYWALGVESSAAARKVESQTEQLWVEKDSFHLYRLLMKTSAEDSDLTEILLEQMKLTRDVPFPRLIKVNRLVGGKSETLLQEEVTDVATQVVVKSDFKGSKTGWSDAAGALDPSTRDLIQNYYRYLR